MGLRPVDGVAEPPGAGDGGREAAVAAPPAAAGLLRPGRSGTRGGLRLGCDAYADMS
ncbi:hypothetical protein [Actinomadura sp. DC4]|uniref:hypothetical protein n=1 Tax=Actinomadura sp. DC4 TaxID=3055069 RepID=UPI0025B246DC|nr:hypothetical protein [Actinomadura sp. DC4]MDN3358320.1 hypothetical protein [Actinomadura sp. DC4]